MKRIIYTLFLFALLIDTIHAENPELPKDSSDLKNMYLDEVLVVSNPKAVDNTFMTTSSISSFNAKTIERENITSIKDVSIIAPNFFIPDYGSKLTTAVYIRGVGTRTNNSVVGMYVDNVPYLDKSIFDFDFLDIERIEILRGPQNTLYGRNTMAGLINVYTKSPFDHQYTRFSVSYGNYNYFRANLSRYGKINSKLAYSASAQYQSTKGYFKNEFTNHRADSSRSVNGRVQLYWKPTDKTSINLATNMEYSWQGGYPYGLIEDNKTLAVNYNDPGAYNRLLSATTLYVDVKFDNCVLINTTGFQFFHDHMKLDQDFTPKQYFNLNQKQRQHSFSHEIILKSKMNNDFKWLAGAFGYNQMLKTNAPVTFMKEGIDSLINSNIKIPSINMGPMGTIHMYDSLMNNQMKIHGDFKTPTFGIATYGKVTFDNLFTEGFSFSAGVRLDYEHAKIKYDSYTTAYAKGGVVFPNNPMFPTLAPFNDTILIKIKGEAKKGHFEVLPRFDISYTPNKKCLAYATLSKGYRAGGYNFQMFSDAIRDQLQGEMIKAFIANADNAGMGSRIPESVRAMAQTNNTNIKKQISYKPEHSWNYEVGARSELVDRTLLVDVALFYIDVRDQQITSFAKEGMGRITKNAGKSRSFGLELGFKYYPVNNLAFYANYGFTDAKFKKNSEDVVESYKNDAGQTVKDTVTIDYKNKHIPFAPAHTMSVGINYLVPLNKNWIDNLNFNAGFSGAGRIYWTEDNSAYQNFYGTLNAKISARKGIVEVSIWGKNLTATSYQAFYFESLGNRFAQKGTPLTFGGELAIKF